MGSNSPTRRTSSLASMALGCPRIALQPWHGLWGSVVGGPGFRFAGQTFGLFDQPPKPAPQFGESWRVSQAVDRDSAGRGRRALLAGHGGLPESRILAWGVDSVRGSGHLGGLDGLGQQPVREPGGRHWPGTWQPRRDSPCRTSPAFPSRGIGRRRMVARLVLPDPGGA